ncbi:2,5-didehydrogluconate reductase DkgB [Catenovulum sediminis]|uniref:2,5-didehydrogluconate reductase DkgB n=1 Tax=Catenovulum sediminis TaxID=1740262 RepID=A0ABV1RBU3_9ALTE
MSQAVGPNCYSLMIEDKIMCTHIDQTDNQNYHVPTMGVGTFRLQGNDAYQSVKTALKLGYRHIDTAQVYNNEADVGKAIVDSQIPRSELFITTKIWMDNLDPNRFLNSTQESLFKLKTDYVDLLLVHWPLNDESIPMSRYLNELRKAKTQGFTRHIGVSNFTRKQMQQAIDILGEGEILTNQIELHPYLQNRSVSEFCQKHNILVTAYMPFAYGDVLKDKVIQAIAVKHKVTPAQIVLAWIVQQGFATIPSSTKSKNLASNLEYEQVQLCAKDMASIAMLERNHRLANPDFAPDWD